MEYVMLKEVCAINMGQSPDSNSYNEVEEGLPFFQGNADFGERYPIARKWCTAPNKIALAEDILISVRAPIGAINFAYEECCIGRGLAALTPDKSKIVPDFLFWFLKHINVELNDKGTGSTFKAIGRNAIEEIKLPNIPLKTQQEISIILGKIHSVIQMRKQEMCKLDDLIKARFIELFGDVVHNDKGWDAFRFSDITSSRLGKMLDAKQQTGKYPFPYLANANVQWFRFETDNLNQMDFNEADQKEFALEDGDLLVCEGGEIGRCAVWHNQVQPCYFQKALHRVRCNQEIVLPDYLAWWFKFNCDNKGFTAIEGAKATIAHLPGSKLKVLSVVVPPLMLQHKFIEFVNQVNKSKVAVQQALDEAQLLFDSLMQEYFG